MTRRAPRFHHAVAALVSAFLAAPLPAPAQQAEADPLGPLFRQLSEARDEGWRAAESDILRAWSRSGSASMDLLLKRGEEALNAGDFDAAIGHLTALTDHAPDFAAGFQLRAVAYAWRGDFGPAAADLARVLQLEPRHFAALTQLGAMLEEMGDQPRALEAYKASLAIHPHQQDALDAVARLTADLEGTAL